VPGFHDGKNHLDGFLHTESEISITVKTKNFRIVNCRNGSNVLMIFGNLESRIGRHFVFESILVLAVVSEKDIFVHVEHTILDILFTKC